MKPQSTAKRLAKAVAVLLTFGSFLGISSTPAIAAEVPGDAPEWTIEVNVDDSSIPECVADPTSATWSPDLIPYYPTGNDIDKFDGSGQSIDFSVDLAFNPGTDMNACIDSPAFYQPSGTVEATFLTIDPELTPSVLACVDICTAESLSLGTNNIYGTLLVDDDAVGGIGVTYSARLKVVWTPAG
jgi:hypothetical protein